MLYVEKYLGETPLECLERVRGQQHITAFTPMTYAGRLDPMASGVLLILIGDECKDKEKFLHADKEYEVEVLFGMSTDTFDMLGIPQKGVNDKLTQVAIQKYIGKCSQEYPAYSSKTVNGVQLHALARSNELPEEMPTKEVEIYSIEDLGTSEIAADTLQARIKKSIAKVSGDFRQTDILSAWNELLEGSSEKFWVQKIKVYCSSGTYMRSLADTMGKESGMGAIALSIRRTKILL